MFVHVSTRNLVFERSWKKTCVWILNLGLVLEAKRANPKSEERRSLNISNMCFECWIARFESVGLDCETQFRSCCLHERYVPCFWLC
jgi:hypothetical protein